MVWFALVAMTIFASVGWLAFTCVMWHVIKTRPPAKPEDSGLQRYQAYKESRR